MATLQKIRNRAGLLIIVIGGALLAFIIGDGLRSGSTFFRLNKNVALTIDGQKVPIEDYQQKLAQRQRFYEQSGRQISEEQRVYLNNSLAQEYIQDYMLRQEAEKLGLKVVDAELSALIYGKGVEQDPGVAGFLGQFGVDATDAQAINQFLTQIDERQIKAMPAEQQSYFMMIAEQWNELTNQLARNRLSQKFASLMERTVAVNNVDAKYLTASVTRDAAVVRASSAALLADSLVTLSDKDLQAFYNKHKEDYKISVPEAQIDYIYLQVRPSAQDTQETTAKVNKAVQDLSAAGTDTKSVTRNYDEGFDQDIYFAQSELSTLGLDPTVVSFITSATPGQVNTPLPVDGNYTVVKLLATKSAPATMQMHLIALDSANLSKRDSIINVINSGAATFAQMVQQYSVDEQSKSMGGSVQFNDPMTGMPKADFTEFEAMQSGVDTLFSVPQGRAFAFNENLILEAANPGETTTKYRFAMVGITDRYSNKTFDAEYAKLNNIFSSGKSFDEMKKEAQKQGLSVMEDVVVSANAANIGMIPDSREVVTWALRSKKGAVNDKIFRCNNDYLIIARINDQIFDGYRSFESVKDRVKDQVLVEKRGAQLAKSLADKKLTTLDQYAEAMQTTVDTLRGISYAVTGANAAELNGHVMTQPMNTLSQPFAARTEVMVVQPLSQTDLGLKPTPADPAMQQQARALGQQMGYRAMQVMQRQLKVKDNRFMFY